MPTPLRKFWLLTLLMGCQSASIALGPPPTDTETIPDSETTTTEVPPAPSTRWTRKEIATPGSATITEIQYNNPEDPEQEWIEIYNPMVYDLDISAWSLSGGIDYTFAEGSRIPANSYIVIAANPARLNVPAQGPYIGSLSDSGERIDLISNGGRLMDTLSYNQDTPWPVAADGSGHSLSKIRPTLASDHAENWTFSVEAGGTPGAPNATDPQAPPTDIEILPLETSWRYDDNGSYPTASWYEANENDSTWQSGTALFYAGSPNERTETTIRVTADNYYAVYLGEEDGSNLRLIAADPNGDWTTVEQFITDATPQDHLYIAAWEAPYDDGGPQMVVAEAETANTLTGTRTADFEWILGPAGDCPGVTPPDPAPDPSILAGYIATGTWATPGIETPVSASPWGWAISSAFDATTQYIWPDTFDSVSITNTDNTYALFRSIAPIVGAAGSTELAGPPTTTLFRTDFNFDHDPSTTRLFATCSIDDGAVFYLNGIEVLRENMPTGPISADTLASTDITSSDDIYLELPTTSLLRGSNVLAVEVHQASLNDPDLRFGCTLTAQISNAPSSLTVVFNEISPASVSPFEIELQNISTQVQDTTGMVIASSSGEELVLSGETLAAGALGRAEMAQGATEDVLFLYSANKARLLDAVRVADLGRGRAAQQWCFETEQTLGTENTIETQDDIVINEIMYHQASLRPETWIELYNRGETAVDLSGWGLVDAIAYSFPEGTMLEPGGYLIVANDAAAVGAEFPVARVIGDFEGALDKQRDRIVLVDALGNIADEVEYFDGGAWPEMADGGGASLELMNPWADNNRAESWAASNETSRSEWVSYELRGVANPSAVGPDGVWNEFVMGLLDAGEVLIDDLSVIQNPDTNPVEVLQNGSFENLDHWRLLGTHRHGQVIHDPDDASNSVLQLIATGPTEHMHNHAETTLTQPIATQPYKITFRARWISGSHQLNTRLYFNRLARTTLLEQPLLAGTPGTSNSRFRENIGPVFNDLRQDIAVPHPGQSVEISVIAEDPDGVRRVMLWSSVAGGAWVGQEMVAVGGRWLANVEGQAAGEVVQFYVEAEDTLGETSLFPAAGPEARALFQVDDGQDATNGLHNFRLIMTETDSDWLLEDVNLMSNDFVRATVVYDGEVFYNVGVRAKGSERGRPETVRLGYGVRFNPEQLFRGSQSSVLIDRSEGVNYGQREMLLNLVMMRAGLVSAEYNDLTQAITPRAEHTGPAELQLDRSTNLLLASQFDQGDEGFVYDYELIYYPYTTQDGTTEGLKLPQPDGVVGTYITDLGSNKESYRWNFTLQNNTDQDQYDPLIRLGQVFALRGSQEFLDQAPDVIDLDLWMRGMAMAMLAGAVDNYGGDSSQHNARFYARPEDGKMLYLPHDLDFFGGSNMAVVGNSDVWYLIQDAVNRRTYYQHVEDIISRAYNLDYLGPWCDQIGALLPNQDFAGHCQFIADRAAWAESGSSDAVIQQFPLVDFSITTHGGTDFSTNTASVSLEGEGWVDVREIRLGGQALAVLWLDGGHWQVTVPLMAGPNTIALEAVNIAGEVVGSDSIGVVFGN